MLQFFSAIKDTANYLRQATNFYDNYYMNISADSLNKRDNENMEKAKKNAMERSKSDSAEVGKVKSFSFSYSSNSFTTELNNAAYSIYKTGTKNSIYLSKAMLWSKRTIELKPIAAYYDTFAHLLYALSLYAEAENAQNKAIEMAKAENKNVKEMQEAFIKIKNKTL